MCGISQDWLKGKTDPRTILYRNTNTNAVRPDIKYRPVIVEVQETFFKSLLSRRESSLHSCPHKAWGTSNVEPGRFLGHALPPGRALLRMGLPEGSPAFLPSLITVLISHKPRQGLAPGQDTSKPATSGLFEYHGHGAVIPKLLLLFGRRAPTATAPSSRPGWGPHSSSFLCLIANYTDSDHCYPKGGSWKPEWWPGDDMNKKSSL